MEHKIRYDDELQILHQQIIGVYSTEETREFGKKYKVLVEGKAIKQLVVDLREAGKMESRDTRSVTNEMLNEAGFTHVVFVGANAATRMIAKVLMKLGTIKAESDFYGDFDSAVEWLKSRRQ